MCLGGYAGKNVCKAGKTSALFSGDASRDNSCYVVAHCARGGKRGGSWEETSQKVLWLAESFQQLKDVLI